MEKWRDLFCWGDCWPKRFLWKPMVSAGMEIKMTSVWWRDSSWLRGTVGLLKGNPQNYDCMFGTRQVTWGGRGEQEIHLPQRQRLLCVTWLSSCGEEKEKRRLEGWGVEKTETDATPLSVALDFKAMWGQQRVNASGDLEKIARNVNPIAIAVWRRMRLSKEMLCAGSNIGVPRLVWRSCGLLLLLPIRDLEMEAMGDLGLENMRGGVHRDRRLIGAISSSHDSDLRRHVQRCQQREMGEARKIQSSQRTSEAADE
jgi:hypothetical protein